jgi:hypothetical protein
MFGDGLGSMYRWEMNDEGLIHVRSVNLSVAGIRGNPHQSSRKTQFTTDKLAVIAKR